MFQFKQFVINQDKCGMKISSSACMLGSLAHISQNVCTVLDIGTGTGLLALMIAQRTALLPDYQKVVLIDAIEIDTDAALQAAQNFATSPWKNRLHLIHTDITTWAFETEKRYEMIVCNPPFFRTSSLSIDEKRRLARHENSLDVPVLADIATTLLTKNGTIWLLIAAASYTHYLSIFEEKKLLLCHEIALWDSPEAEKCFCYILQFSSRQEGKISEKYYFRDAKNGAYSADYEKAMKDFLIIF